MPQLCHLDEPIALPYKLEKIILKERPSLVHHIIDGHFFILHL